MAIIVGITGGIGSGKTTACRIFEVLGTQVFYADDEAKALYSADEELKQAVIRAFGSDIYPDGNFSKVNLAAIVFANSEKLAHLNSLVHPALARRFKTWRDQHDDEKYLLKEAAILIESGMHEACNEIIVVSCPEEIRINRVAQRDDVSEEAVRDRVKHQLNELERLKYASFEIDNSGSNPMTPQITQIHEQLISKVQTH